MDYKINRKNFHRDTYFCDRLKSIKPRLNNIIDWEFEKEYLRRMREDDKRMDEINHIIDDYTQHDHVYIKIDGDDDAARHVLGSQPLTVRQCSDTDIMRETASVQELCIPVIIIQSHVGHKELSSEIQERLSIHSENVRKYNVLVLLTKKSENESEARQRMKYLKQFLETDFSNFEADKCVVSLPLPKENIEESHRPLTRQISREKQLKRDSCELVSNSDVETPPGSPPKRPHEQQQDEVLADRLNAASSELKGASCCSSESTGSKLVTKINEEVSLARAIAHQLVCRAIDIVEVIVQYLLELKRRRDAAAQEEQFTELDKILYELRGLYNISDTKIGRERMKDSSKGAVPDELSSDLLKEEHVKGFGRIYGNLVIHVDATIGDEAIENAKQRIRGLIEKHKYSATYNISTIAKKPYRRADIIMSPG